MFELVVNEKNLKSGVLFFTFDGEEWYLAEEGTKNPYNGVIYECVLENMEGDVFTGDILLSKRGTILNVRPRELLSNKKNGRYIVREDLIFVNKHVRKALERYFSNDKVVVNMEKDCVWCFEKEHYLHCHGDFMPYVSEGCLVIPDYSVSGVNYFVLTEEDAAWFEYQTGLNLF